MSETMTPYAAAKIVNEQLAELDIDKVVPPQMLYTYVKKNYIKSVTVDGKQRVTNESLTEWFVGYVNKLSGKAVPKKVTPSPYNFADLADTDEDPEEDLAIEAEFGTDEA